MKLKQIHARSVALVAFLPLVASLVGCGAAVAPRELEDAREAFHKAKDGPASKYALAELETAKQSLQQAEASFNDGDDENVPNYAYIAERKSQLADAAGALEEAKRARADALVAQQKARDDFQHFTEQRLNKAEHDLQETQRTAADAQAKLTDEQARRLAAEKKAAAALASLEQMAQVKEESRGVVITLSGSVLFASGKSELLDIARSKLDDVAKALKDQGYKSIVVEGHTDSRGGDSANLVLSERRAQAVVSHLISQGIDSSKIKAVGIGESRPVASNETSEGRANNRRVEIIVQPE
ncbi:MAG TPA: OmpA family protein [Polyangiaceae bacterium]|nr:OmpA family protein [Polyangiaceae bacterium]